MKEKSLTVLLSIALTLSITGCSNERQVDAEKTKTESTSSIRTTKNSTDSVSSKKNDTELTYRRDLNRDGIEEIIKVIFKYDTAGGGMPEKAQSYDIYISSGDKQYTYEAKAESNVNSDTIYFTDFETKDNYIEFYINSEGPSDDNMSAIYRFDGDGIKRVCDTVGYIREYDREGKIYTEFSKTHDKYAVTLSYYDINKGKVQFLSKSSLIGKKLQYDNSLILFTDNTNKSKSYKSYIDDNSGKEEVQKVISIYNKDSIVKVCEPNEVLTITDIDNTYHGLFKEGRERNIRIKVKASDGKEGWLEWLNGGD